MYTLLVCLQNGSSKDQMVSCQLDTNGILFTVVSKSKALQVSSNVQYIMYILYI